MLAMTLHAPAHPPLAMVSRDTPAPGPARCCCACAPARCAAPTCTSSTANCRAAPAAGARARDRRAVSSARRRRHRPHVGERVGVPWLGGTCGLCAIAARRREPVRRPGVHRLHARRRLRHPRGGRCALLLFAGRPGAGRRLGRAAAVRRADRLARAAGRGRRAGARAVRLRRRGAPDRAGGAPAGAHGVRVHATRRRCGAGARARARRRLGRRSDDPPPRALDAAILFAPVGALVPRALRPCARAAASSAPAST